MRVARVGVDGLVFLEPLAHRIPLESDSAVQLPGRARRVAAGGAVGSGPAGNLDCQQLRLAQALICVSAYWDQLGADVGGRYVVSRVIGLLPDQQRTCRVRD